MIIIFEGADKTGKTTLAKKIASQQKMPLYIPPRYRNGDFDSATAELFYRGVNQTVLEACEIFDNFILDRFFISDFVYSKFFRREMNLNPLQVADVIKVKTLVVLTEASFEDQQSRADERLDHANEEIKKSLFRVFLNIYQKEFGKHFRFLQLNTSKMDEKECIERIRISITDFKKEKI